MPVIKLLVLNICHHSINNSDNLSNSKHAIYIHIIRPVFSDPPWIENALIPVPLSQLALVIEVQSIYVEHRNWLNRSPNLLQRTCAVRDRFLLTVSRNRSASNELKYLFHQYSLHDFHGFLLDVNDETLGNYLARFWLLLVHLVSLVRIDPETSDKHLNRVFDLSLDFSDKFWSKSFLLSYSWKISSVGSIG